MTRKRTANKNVGRLLANHRQEKETSSHRFISNPKKWKRSTNGFRQNIAPFAKKKFGIRWFILKMQKFSLLLMDLLPVYVIVRLSLLVIMELPPDCCVR